MKKPTICAKPLLSQRVPKAVLWILQHRVRKRVSGSSPSYTVQATLYTEVVLAHLVKASEVEGRNQPERQLAGN
jgi:hypothetical protein